MCGRDARVPSAGWKPALHPEARRFGNNSTVKIKAVGALCANGFLNSQKQLYAKNL